MLELAYMSIEGMTEQDRESLYSCVAAERREQLMARKNRLSADLSLAGEVLARWMLWKAVMQLEEERQAQCDCIPDDFPYSKGIPGVIKPKDFVILRDADGKPYQETVPGLFFNYSHSGTMVACGIAGENIGVDIQKRTEGSRVREKVYCQEEWNEENGSDDSLHFFTEVWAKKESYLKLTGEGLRKDMTSLHLRKMQEEGAVQWYGGWVTEAYCLYACIEGSQEKTVLCNFTRNKTGEFNGLNRNDEKGDRKYDTGSMYQIRLSEVIDLLKSIQET